MDSSARFELRKFLRREIRSADVFCRSTDPLMIIQAIGFRYRLRPCPTDHGPPTRLLHSYLPARLRRTHPSSLWPAHLKSAVIVFAFVGGKEIGPAGMAVIMIEAASQPA